MSIIAKYIVLSVKKNFAYRINAWLVILDTLMDCVSIGLFWFSLLELDFDFIGWSKDYIILFMGFSLISSAFTLLFVGVWDIGEHIRKGTLDSYLVKPCNAVLLILLERANFLRFFVTLPIGLILVLLKAGNAGFLAIMSSLLLCVVSSIVVQLVMVTLYETSFWIKKVDSYADVTSAIFSVSSYPMIFFGQKILMLFTYIVPIAFVGTIPTEIIMGKTPTLLSLLISLGSAIIIMMMTYCVWKAGRKRYESAN